MRMGALDKKGRMNKIPNNVKTLAKGYGH